MALPYPGKSPVQRARGTGGVVRCTHETGPPRRASRRWRALFVGGLIAAAAPPAAAADAPTVASLSSLMERDIHWGMSHAEVTDVYNRLNGLFDREYAPQLAKLQPGVDMQQLEADRDNRKANFERSFAPFDWWCQPATTSHLSTWSTRTITAKPWSRLFKDGESATFSSSRIT